MTPAEELRAAASTERYVWTSTNNSRPDPTAQAIHLALAELLEHIADDMNDDGATEWIHPRVDGGTFIGVHPDGFGTPSPDPGTMRFEWTAALKVARAINGGGM